MGKWHLEEPGSQSAQLPKPVFRILPTIPLAPMILDLQWTQASCFFRSVCDLTVFTALLYPRLLAQLSIVCNIQDLVWLQEAHNLSAVYHLLLIIRANKTATGFSFCFQHFKASTFLVKTPRPIITLTPIKGTLAWQSFALSNFQT